MLQLILVLTQKQRLGLGDAGQLGHRQSAFLLAQDGVQVELDGESVAESNARLVQE